MLYNDQNEIDIKINETDVTNHDSNQNNYDVALKYLRSSINKNASFRDGQWSAINQVVNLKKRLLVVQRTGWGKSSVYFISTKILRKQNYGPTLIISPLLSLMRNQIEYAKRLNLKVQTINSSNSDDHNLIKEKVLEKKVDALIISPERLSNDEFVSEILTPITNKIGLLVIDEAHCISDWGHDFRPDYKRIKNIIKQLPDGIPVLATTATANDRVIQDIESQIDDISVERGGLMRESLHLQNLNLPRKADRLGWLADNLLTLEGTGIIYTLTVKDAKLVNEWLNENNIISAVYHGAQASDEREKIEQDFLNNEFKVLVATKALGMGFDKPDVNFIIHYQMPSSSIQYYQEVGRAGRSIEKAYGILMNGSEDTDIHEFFRKTAFPSVDDINQLLEVIGENDGLTFNQICQKLNMRRGKIEKILKQLLSDTRASIAKNEGNYYKTPIAYERKDEDIQKIIEQRELEWSEMLSYFSESKECLMKVLSKRLDDKKIQNCGKCSNCIEKSMFNENISRDNMFKVNQFLKYTEFEIEMKKRIPAGLFNLYPFKGIIPNNLRPDGAKCLSRWGDGGLGEDVKEGKLSGTFSDSLVEETLKMIERWGIEVSWVTCVPSRNHPNLVPDFAKKIARGLQLPFMDVIEKVRSNDFQKNQENTFHQAKNLDGVFEVDGEKINTLPVLIIDDIFDSGWTFTVCTALLKNAGVKKVYPLALSSSGLQ